MTAVISGATRGIGRAVAFALAREGYDLALGSRNSQQLEQLKKDISDAFPEIKIMIKQVDFGNKQQVKSFTDSVSGQFGSIDVIVNNVGVFYTGTVSSEPEDLFEKHMAVNLNSAWYLTRPFLKGMKEKRSGFIFNICSTAAKNPRTEAASYSISKMAMYAFHQVLCQEMRDYDVKVTAILPGSVNTSSWTGVSAPVDKFVQPEDVALAVISALKTSKNAYTEEITLKPLDKTW